MSGLQTELNGKVAKTGDTMTGELELRYALPVLKFRDTTPDDTLVIKIHKIRPNIETGRSGTSTSYASLTSTKVTPLEIRYQRTGPRETVTGALQKK